MILFLIVGVICLPWQQEENNYLSHVKTENSNFVYEYLLTKDIFSFWLLGEISYHDNIRGFILSATGKIECSNCVSGCFIIFLN